MTSPAASVRLTAVRRLAADEQSRGLVRVASTVLAALGIGALDVVHLEGTRRTGALAAVAPAGTPPDLLLCDELTQANLGVADGTVVEVRAAAILPATTVVVHGPPEVVATIDVALLRSALHGKVLTAGDAASLLVQDLPEVAAPDRAQARKSISNRLMFQATTVRVSVLDVVPPGPVLVGAGTKVRWHDAAEPVPVAAPVPVVAPRQAADLPGLEEQVARLKEWLDLGFSHPALLARLGSAPQMGVLVAGPAGSGKASLVEAVAADLGVGLVRAWCPELAALTPDDAATRLRALLAAPGVVLLEDVDALDGPLLPTLLGLVRTAVEGGRTAVVCTTSRPEAVSEQLTSPGLLEHALVVPLPDKAQRRRLLGALTASLPLADDVSLDDVATRTPGFVAADLQSLLRTAGTRAAARQRDAASPSVAAVDVEGALGVVRPTAAQGTLELGGLTLDDVGDMVEVKQALTEAVLWPLRYPDTFTSLGVSPPRGVLLYGPPGCGKTFLVRALAGSGEANVLTVKGAELLSKWVGESEAAVRELFRRARESAPSLVFLDEVDALAPVRGAGNDGGTTDRVVAALLTELDGIEQMRDVVVVGATNRPDRIDPALLRPGRLERLVFVPPPDAAARTEILKAASRKVPLQTDAQPQVEATPPLYAGHPDWPLPPVDLEELGRRTEGFSAADCAALIREAALAAMRESQDGAPGDQRPRRGGAEGGPAVAGPRAGGRAGGLRAGPPGPLGGRGLRQRSLLDQRRLPDRSGLPRRGRRGPRGGGPDPLRHQLAERSGRHHPGGRRGGRERRQSGLDGEGVRDRLHRSCLSSGRLREGRVLGGERDRGHQRSEARGGTLPHGDVVGEDDEVLGRHEPGHEGVQQPGQPDVEGAVAAGEAPDRAGVGGQGGLLRLSGTLGRGDHRLVVALGLHGGGQHGVDPGHGVGGDERLDEDGPDSGPGLGGRAAQPVQPGDRPDDGGAPLERTSPGRRRGRLDRHGLLRRDLPGASDVGGARGPGQHGPHPGELGGAGPGQQRGDRAVDSRPERRHRPPDPVGVAGALPPERPARERLGVERGLERLAEAAPRLQRTPAEVSQRGERRQDVVLRVQLVGGRPAVPHPGPGPPDPVAREGRLLGHEGEVGRCPDTGSPGDDSLEAARGRGQRSAEIAVSQPARPVPAARAEGAGGDQPGEGEQRGASAGGRRRLGVEQLLEQRVHRGSMHPRRGPRQPVVAGRAAQGSSCSSRATTPGGPSTTTSARSASSGGPSSLPLQTVNPGTPRARSSSTAAKPGRSPTSSPANSTADGRGSASDSRASRLSLPGARSSRTDRPGWTSRPCSAARACRGPRSRCRAAAGSGQPRVWTTRARPLSSSVAPSSRGGTSRRRSASPGACSPVVCTPASQRSRPYAPRTTRPGRSARPASRTATSAGRPVTSATRPSFGATDLSAATAPGAGTASSGSATTGARVPS